MENKICGATDSPLTEKGRRQADELGQEILRQGLQIDEILYSPLSRAADTAQHVSGIARAVQSYFNDMTNAEFAAFGIKNCEVRRFDF